MIILINALKIIFVLGFLILIHELGHFTVAKLCKVKVNEFSIGFGPKILKKQGKQTKYTLRLIPLGGYVSMEGEDEHSDKEDSFTNASIPKRMAIILAGGLVNIMFALVVYFILMTSVGNNTSLVIDELIPNYAAEKVGLEVNDEIIKINGKNINTKNDLDKILNKSNGEELILNIKRNQEKQEIKLVPTKQEYKNTGIYLKATGNENSTKILTLDTGSSAEKAGLQANDIILKINDIDVENSNDIINAINSIETENIEITVERNNEIIEFDFIPDTQSKYYLGVYFKKADNTLGNNMYYAVFETKDFLTSIFDNIKMLFTGKVKADQLMGPVGISEVVASTSGVSDYIYILALVSISLGITNLLPFPALDGGKFVLLLIEAIRRKRLSEKVEINIQLIGFAILIAIAIYVTYNDILRIL